MRGGSTPAAAARGAISTTPIAITTANAKAAAAGGYGSGSTSAKGSAVGVVVDTTAPRRHILKEHVATTLERVRIAKMVSAPTGVIAAVTNNCAGGGTSRETYIDADNSNVVSIGDTITITDTNCVDVGVTTNGVTSVKIVDITGAGTDADPEIVVFSATFSNLVSQDGLETFTMNGDANIAFLTGATFTQFQLTGTLLQSDSSIDGAADLRNYSMVFGTEGGQDYILLDLIFDDKDGRVTIATPNLLVLHPTTGDPLSGVLTVTGAGGSIVTLTAQADGVNVGMTVDPDGAGSMPVASLANTTWAEL